MPENLGIILVDHGSTRAEANDMLTKVASMFREVSKAKIVEPAHMELAHPTIAEAFARCVEQGAGFIVVHPYFLAPGQHSTHDIPRLTSEAAQSHSGVRYAITKPLGLDDKLIDVIRERVRETLEEHQK